MYLITRKATKKTVIFLGEWTIYDIGIEYEIRKTKRATHLAALNDSTGGELDRECV